MSLNTCIDFIQQQELIQKSNHDKSQHSEQIFTNTYMLKKIKKCLYCGCEHEIKREKCPTFGKTCTNYLKKNHFQAVCKFQKKNFERIEENETNMQVFSVKSKNKNVEKIEQKKKDIILKVKINNFNLDMQMDTGSEVMFIRRNFWECIGKPTLWKSSLLQRQFDGLVIKSLGYFEGSLELDDKF